MRSGEEHQGWFILLEGWYWFFLLYPSGQVEECLKKKVHDIQVKSALDAEKSLELKKKT